MVYLTQLEPRFMVKTIIFSNFFKLNYCKFLDYLPPDPLEFTGIHRYIFILYEQRFSYIEIPVPPSRFYFDLFEWLQKIYPNGGICGPIASTEFRTSFNSDELIFTSLY